MELKALVKHLNTVLELEPPIPLDNEKGTLSELKEVCESCVAVEDVEALSKNAARELLKRKLFDTCPTEVINMVRKKAGYKPLEEKEATKSEKKAKKVEPKPSTEAKVIKPKITETEKKERKTGESNEALAARYLSEGRTIKAFEKELGIRYGKKGKEFSEDWLENRAKIYWRIAQK